MLKTFCIFVGAILILIGLCVATGLKLIQFPAILCLVVGGAMYGIGIGIDLSEQ